MPVNVDTHILPELPDALWTAQRALWYADGLFESIRMSDGQLPWLPYHWERLYSGMKALDYDIPPDWGVDFFKKEIEKIAAGHARIRLQVWRAPGGLYKPEQNIPHFVITAEPLAGAVFEWNSTGIHLGLSTRVRIPVDAYSGFKSLNTARYVAAALEGRREGWDEVVILNCFDRIAEASTSNIFWWEQDGFLCTPPLTEGGVNGVTRRMVVKHARELGLAVQEKSATFAALQSVEEIFLTNAIRGIVPVARLCNHSLATVKTKYLFDQFAGTFPVK